MKKSLLTHAATAAAGIIAALLIMRAGQKPLQLSCPPCPPCPEACIEVQALDVEGLARKVGRGATLNFTFAPVYTGTTIIRGDTATQKKPI